VVLLPTLAAAVAGVIQHQPLQAVELAVVVPEAFILHWWLLLQEPQIQAAAVAVAGLDLKRAQQAAPASSSSSTTSALPQSSPSSHRRSGLPLLAR
jgi:hypothetical protein